MLQLQNISLVRFRNYIEQQFVFTKNIVGICGKNGVGKTNLLDAIYYLSFTKSYFNRIDSSNSSHNLQGFRIDGNYLLNQRNININCIVRENNKKEFCLNGDEYKKLSEHIGKIPCVMIAPDDIELISGGSEIRRRYLDMILSQTNDTYLQNLIDYNNILQQRNSLLKQYATTGNLDNVLFAIITNQLAEKGSLIFIERQQFLAQLLPIVLANYNIIANTTDELVCNYQSQFIVKCVNIADSQNQEITQHYLKLLNQNLQNDMALQRTNIGIHKDDIEILIGNNKFKIEASQGQRKSLLFAFKLTEWQLIKDKKGFSPVLLLDDVFEKLDTERMHNLLQIVTTFSDAQIFITDTHKERLENHLNNLNKAFEILEV